jgi:UDP-N-acetylmuramoylalanine--D-glutamate ligase
MMELAGKSVYVLGMGLSGVSAALLCLERGARVLGIDQRARVDLSEAAQRLSIEIRTGGDAAGLMSSLARGGSDLIVVSPGVDERPALDAAAAAGIEVIGELELGARFSEAPLCAVGGTNGKSTTTELIGAMLRQAGQSIFCGGNLGTPLTRAVGQAWDCLVVEVSSFQLERAPTFRPKVSLLLNITDDHLDRHGTFAAYAAAKGNAFANQTPDDVAIAPWGDAEVARQVRRGQGRVVYFGAEGDYVVRDGGVLEVSSSVTRRRPLPRLEPWGLLPTRFGERSWRIGRCHTAWPGSRTSVGWLSMTIPRRPTLEPQRRPSIACRSPRWC